MAKMNAERVLRIHDIETSLAKLKEKVDGFKNEKTRI